ncbi:MAG: acyltransferase family protein [Telluria sp.]
MAPGTPHRLTEIDALRGVAAMLVVLFHYTTRFDELYGHTAAPVFSVPWGHLGVNLFFMISGFVIFMTLERTSRPLDFIVSRFSRLYPAYWAAVLCTFAITAWLGLPGKTVGPDAAVLNLAMFHSLFNVPNVDGVYWTLEVELIFYAWALLAFRMRLLDKVHALLATLLVLRLAYYVSGELWRDLPWMVSRLLILQYIPWFAAGVMVYRRASQGDTRVRDWALGLFAAATLAVVEGPGMGLLCVGVAGVLGAAATGRLPLLRNGVLVWLGTISYTLYLVHENIGWAMMLRLERLGMGPNLAIALALAATLALACLLTYTIEQPAMRWVRDRYKALRAARLAGAGVR